MQSKSNRVISLAMSAALMLTNMIAPMKVYADDAMDTYVEYGEEDSIPAEPETQAPAIEYTITLPYYEDIVYMVDEGRIYQPEDKKPEDKDILLKYLADEKVEFAFTPYNDVTVTELHLKDEKKEETAFEVDEYGKVSFLMPEKDLWFSLVYESPAADHTVEVVPEQAAEEPFQAVPEDVGTENHEEVSQETGEPVVIPDADQATGDSEDNTVSAETDTGNDQSSAPEIELTAVIEDDGLPAQGSIMTVDALNIPLGDMFHADTDLTNISYDAAIDSVDLVSDEVDVSIPGTYSTIYRVNHNGGEKMWYVLRPVVVMELGEVREGERRYRLCIRR